MSVDDTTDLQGRRVFSLPMTALLIAMVILGAMENMSISALPILQREIGMSVAEAAMCASIAGIVATVSLTLIGKLGDIVGAKIVVVTSMSLAVLGGITCSLANSVVMVVVGFVLLGLGGSAIASAIGLLRQITESEGRPNATGMFIGAITFGGSAGAVMAGPVADVASRFWMYVAPAAVLGVVVVVSIFALPSFEVRQPTGRTRFDWPGLLAFGTSLVALQLGMLWSSTFGWTSPRVLACFSLMILAAIAFFLIERKSSRPFIDVSMMLRPSMLGSILIGLITGFSYAVSFFLFQQLLVLPASAGSPGFGYSLTEISLTLAPGVLLGIIIAPIASKYVRLLGLRPIVAGALLFLISGSAIMIWWHEEPWQIILASVLIVGFAGPMLYTATIIGAELSVGTAETGIATSLVMTSRAIGAIVGVPVAAAVLLTGSSPDFPFPTNTGFQLNYALAACFAIFALLAIRLLPAKASPKSTQITSYEVKA